MENKCLQGRVIKKAKRRNLNEDQKKNIFSSFGGFSSSNNVAAADAFSFLAKPQANGTDPKAAELSGFSFGSENTVAKKEDESQKEQDNKENKKEDSAESKPVDDLFAKFMKPKVGGSWVCDVCMISNPAEADKCVACESPRPGAAASKPPAPVTPAQPAAPVDDLFAKFMKPKAGGSWTCEVCMISNPGDRNTCIACETPRPGAAPVTAPAEDEKKPAQSFQFGSAGGFKFGSGDSSSKPETDNSNSGFSFGTTNSSIAQENPTGGFKFGSSDESKKDTEANPAGGFTFGEAKESKESNSGFTFGSSKVESKEEPKQGTGFSFGGSKAEPVEEEKKSSGFSFGVSSDKTSLGSVSTPISKGFQFSEKMGLKVAMSASDTPKTKTNKGEYLSNLKSLNTQVTSWIKSHVDQNPLIDLTPVFKDYEKHISEMRTKCNIKASVIGSAEKAEMKEATKALTFGASAISAPSPFTSSTFGASQSIFGSTPKTGFSFGFGSSQTNDNDDHGTIKEEAGEKEEKEEESSSPQKQTEVVIEEDALYTKKCKLFYKKADAYEDRGLGNIHLKLTEDKKLQMIVRAATSLGNILLNVLVTPETPVERLGKNNVMIVTIPNPPIEKNESDQKPVTFLIRVKTAEDADELKDKIVSLGK